MVLQLRIFYHELIAIMRVIYVKCLPIYVCMVSQKAEICSYKVDYLPISRMKALIIPGQTEILLRLNCILLLLLYVWIVVGFL